MDTQFDGMSPEVLSWSRARAILGYKGKDIPGEVRTLDISPSNPKQVRWGTVCVRGGGGGGGGRNGRG